MTTHTWTLDQKVVLSILHTLAIITGIFRSSYRWYISRFWWEDVWAVVALLLDIVSFVCVWMPQSPNPHLSNVVIATLWMEAIVLTSGLWAARMSMITSIIRITHHHVLFRRFAYAVAVAFGMMWIAVLIQKLHVCVIRTCYLTHDIEMSQLVTDVISDTLLMILPLYFLRGVKIDHRQRILLVSSFASSICITVISITHSVFLFLPYTGMALILAHIKTALALIICNLLVIVTLIYRLCHRSDVDLDGIPRGSDGVQFTSIIPGQWSLGGVPHSTSSPETLMPVLPEIDSKPIAPTTVNTQLLE